jgi:PIN domain nuclease of toxin-antitoxin system
VKLLLDTQVLILAGQDRLPRPAREVVLDVSHSLFYSLVSFWEIGIKASRGTLRLGMPLTELAMLVESELGVEEEPLRIEAIEMATKFPFHHKDPFDRLLAGQALFSGYSMVSSDSIFEKYGCTRVW